jgi:signal transduction histidine kinase
MPLLVLGVQLVGMVVVPQAMNPATFLALLVCAYTVSVHYRHGMVPVVALSAAAAVIAHTFSGLVPSIPGGLTPVAIVLPVWLAGRSIRNWRARAAMFQEQALSAEREREAALRLAVAGERARIARELHDVVSHHVSVMVIQSGAASSVLRSDPDAAARALRASEASGREAMAELRHLLGVLSRRTTTRRWRRNPASINSTHWSIGSPPPGSR